jgi:hypothetical protein
MAKIKELCCTFFNKIILLLLEQPCHFLTNHIFQMFNKHKCTASSHQCLVYTVTNTHYCHLSARVDAWACRVYLGCVLSNNFLCRGGESFLVCWHAGDGWAKLLQPVLVAGAVLREAAEAGRSKAGADQEVVMLLLLPPSPLPSLTCDGNELTVSQQWQ